MLPYSKQSIDAQDIAAVVEVLNSDWLTTGPFVERFETAVADHVTARHAVAFCNGTAALHGALSVCELKEGDEVIVPAITFVATANAAVYCGATPVFADIDRDTLLIDPQDVVRKITSRTRAIVAMDYAGQPCDYPTLRQIASRNNLMLIADSCHSIGARSFGRQVPQWVDMACYSFHPVKPMTTAEGGMVVTDKPAIASGLRCFRNHGIATDHHQRAKTGTCSYDMQTLGYNYRLSDIQCALGLSQLAKLSRWTGQRATIAKQYDEQLGSVDFLNPLVTRTGAVHAHHLYVVRWDEQKTGVARDLVIQQLRAQGIHANVHYRPVYQHSYYQQLSTHPRLTNCRNAEDLSRQIISLPIFPAMDADDVNRVVDELKTIAKSGSTKAQVA